MVVDKDVSVAELLKVAWDSRVENFLLFIFVISLAVVMSIFKQDRYTAEVLLMPTEEASGGGLSAISNSLGGLASLAGVDISSGNGRQVSEAVEVLRSRKFLISFIEEQNLSADIVAAKYWDSNANKIIYDDRLFDSSENKWIRTEGGRNSVPPSMLEVYEVFKGDFDVSHDRSEGFVRLKVTHYSPYAARDWLLNIVRKLNLTMREDSIRLAETSRLFLERELERSQVADMRVVFYEMIEEQVKRKMLASVREEYVFKIVDPPLVEEEPSEPNRIVIILSGIFMGIVVMFVKVLVQVSSQKARVLED